MKIVLKRPCCICQIIVLELTSYYLQQAKQHMQCIASVQAVGFAFLKQSPAYVYQQSSTQAAAALIMKD